MYDLKKNETVYRKLNMLKTWRLRYTDKSEYLDKVILNMFYELYTTEKLWPEIEYKFFKKSFFNASPKRYDDFNSALNHTIDLWNHIKLTEVNPNLISWMEKDIPAFGMKFSQYKEGLLYDAQNGDNNAVEEIEFSYACLLSINELILVWASFGLMGMNKHEAFVQTTGGDIGEVQVNQGAILNSIENIYQYLNTLANWPINDHYQKIDDLW